MKENLFKDFKTSTKEEWLEVLKKELKGLDFEENLIKKDAIEGLTYPSFFHRDDAKKTAEAPGIFPYKRGNTGEINDWEIVSEIEVLDSKVANKKALDLLMSGTTALVFKLSTQKTDFEVLLNGIELAFIKVYFTICDVAQFQAVKAAMDTRKCREVLYLWNPLAGEADDSVFEAVKGSQKSLSRYFEVDAYSLQQSGANIAQELAFALSLGHEYLLRQLKAGLSIDEALVNLHFTLGVGSSYLFEIAKFRAFRMLWASIARSYEPEHRCNELVCVTAKTGFLNKSMRDPYTNLLRQTTEAMSAAQGGANQLWIQPYDAHTEAGASDFAQRMATNISLILKEESYMEKVIDAVGGSYAIEALTEQIADQAWALFQEMEQNGGVNGDLLKDKVLETARLRVQLLRDKKKTLIGVNKYPAPEEKELKLRPTTGLYFGLPALVLEQELAILVNKGV